MQNSEFLSGFERDFILGHMKNDCDFLRMRFSANITKVVTVTRKDFFFMGDKIVFFHNRLPELDNNAGSEVDVLFYFRQLGLVFSSFLLDGLDGLSLVIPSAIRRISFKHADRSEKLGGTLSYIVDGVKFQTRCRIQKNCISTAENGDGRLQAVKDSISRFYSNEESFDTVSAGKELLYKIIYLDSECVLLASDGGPELDDGMSYDLSLDFDILPQARMKRTVRTTCNILRTFEFNAAPRKKCWLFKFQTMKEEDCRFMSEKIRNFL